VRGDWAARIAWEGREILRLRAPTPCPMKGQGEKESPAHSAQNDGAKSPPSENEGRAPGKGQQIPRRPRAGASLGMTTWGCAGLPGTNHRDAKNAKEPGATFTPQAKAYPRKTRVGHPEDKSRSLVGQERASLGMTAWGCAGLPGTNHRDAKNAKEPGATFTPQAKAHPQKTRVGTRKTEADPSSAKSGPRSG